MELEELIKELPKKVVYTRTFTYDPEEVARSWYDMNKTVMTEQEVLDMIADWAREDMLTPPSRHDFFAEEIYE